MTIDMDTRITAALIAIRKHTRAVQREWSQHVRELDALELRRDHNGDDTVLEATSAAIGAEIANLFGALASINMIPLPGDLKGDAPEAEPEPPEEITPEPPLEEDPDTLPEIPDPSDPESTDPEPAPPAEPIEPQGRYGLNGRMSKTSIHPGDYRGHSLPAKPGNQIAHAVRNAIRMADEAGDETVQCFLPPGTFPGISLEDGQGWREQSPDSIVDVRGLNGRALHIYGHPRKRTVLRPVSKTGGSTVYLEPVQGFQGVVLHDLDIYASGASCLSGGLWGSQKRHPMSVECHRVRFLDDPGGVETVRPVSLNQFQVRFYDCEWDLADCQEHAWYLRNPWGRNEMKGCKTLKVGAQVHQVVCRPLEGPFYEGAVLIVERNWFEGYHSFNRPGFGNRNGFALTVAGGIRDYTCKNNVVIDHDPTDNVYGGLVIWDGGDAQGKPAYYPYDSKGVPLETSFADRLRGELVGKHATRRVLMHGNQFVQVGGDREIMQINSVADAIISENGIWGNRGVSIGSKYLDGKVTDGGIGSLLFEKNNREEDREAALQLGVPEQFLIDPVVLFQRRQLPKRVSGTELKVENDAIV